PPAHLQHLLHTCPYASVRATNTSCSQICTLSLHDALPISQDDHRHPDRRYRVGLRQPAARVPAGPLPHLERQQAGEHKVGEWTRSEEHTSELQSHLNLVCRLLLEKKKRNTRKDR